MIRGIFFCTAGDFVKARNLQERDMLSLYRDAQGSYVRDIGNLVKWLLIISFISCSSDLAVADWVVLIYQRCDL